MARLKGALIASTSLLWLFPLGAARAADDHAALQQLRADIAERDKSLAAMQRRLDALEGEVAALRGRASEAPAPEPTVLGEAPPSSGGRSASGPGAKIGAQTAGAESSTELQEASRALERSLVLTGGLLLPKGAIEVEPNVQYASVHTNGLLITPAAGGLFSLATQDVRSQAIAYGAAVRAGLPWRSQLELDIPALYQRSDVNLGGVGRSSSANGLGDIQVSLSNQFLLDSGWRPGLIGSITYKAPTASGRLVNLGGGGAGLTTINSTLGFPGVAIGLTAVKRHDPLVFFGGYSHQFNLEHERNGLKITPGDSDTYRAGLLLAVSPDFSLRTQFLVEHGRPFKTQGLPQQGLGYTAGIVTFGGSMALSDSTALDVEFGTGVTRDAPDFTVAVSLPVRF